MHNNPKTIKSTRPPTLAASFATGPKRWISHASSPEPNYSQSAEKNYGRYLALARAEALIGNTVGAENLLPARRTLFQINELVSASW
jgi:hypothetical protein